MLYYVVTGTTKVGPFPSAKLAEDFSGQTGGTVLQGKFDPRAISPLTVLPEWEKTKEYVQEYLRWSREILRPAQETASEL